QISGRSRSGIGPDNLVNTMKLIARDDLCLPIPGLTVGKQLQNPGALGEPDRVEHRFETALPVLISKADKKVPHQLAIGFKVPVDAAWRVTVAGDNISHQNRYSDRRNAIAVESRHKPVLHLIKAGHIQGDRVIKYPRAAAHNRSAVAGDQRCERDSRRQIDISGNGVVIVAGAVLHRQRWTYGPGVLRIAHQRGLVAVQHPGADEDTFLDARAVFAHDVNWTAYVGAGEGFIGQARPDLQEVRRTPWCECICVQPLDPAAGTVLVVEIAA